MLEDHVRRFIFIFKVIQDLLKFVSPQILKQLIKFVQDNASGEDGNDDSLMSSSSSWRGYFLAVSLFLINVLQLLVLQQYWIRVYQVGKTIVRFKLVIIKLAHVKDFKRTDMPRTSSRDLQHVRNVQYISQFIHD